MANNKSYYQQLADSRAPKRPFWKNCLHAFWVGGLICTIGQAIQLFFITFFDFNEQTAGDPTLAVLIITSVLLTSLGVYDKLAQFAGAGSAVPVTGFANSMASAAIEHRTEGFVLGVGGNMFKLAGSVIVFGTVAAFIVAIIRMLLVEGGIL
ncbi:stage V sporulation protein AC [Salsuginibacillus halophilus]|uniref:Stage V sporulation protein AC n=1 Tax=Salsuginibacillus halophilus TaxID=517424 RepID=A0A2P8HW63_9BACI|nr:stage V sporulation protein AC [Salsuginibacillus halophilus]PSL50404.1 stage V sporulation protein AC [Salsuginibacillus halophilus]